MKILIYCHRIGSRTINFIQNEIRELDKIHEVLLLYHIDKGQNPLEISNKRKVRHYENRHIAKGIKILNSLGIGLKCFKSELDRIISEFKPDVLHIHFGHSAYRVLQSYDFINVPTVVSFHGIDASKWLADKRYVSRLNYCFKNLNVKPIFVSDFMRNNCKNNGMEFDDSFVLYYGTDLKYFERYTKPYSTSPPQFLQVSSFRPKKGHKTTLKAFKLFEEKHKKPFKLILAGGGDMLNEIKSFAEELNFSNIVSFPGWVDKQGAKKLMSEANIFVHHSVTGPSGDMEGIPNAIMEAMGMELPVLSSIHSGIPELVENGENGFLVQEFDVESYAERINDIYDWELQPKNRTKVLEAFEQEVHKKRLLDIYTSVRQ